MEKKLLWLYDDLMDLFGDSGNIRALAFRMEKAGAEVSIDRRSVGDEVNFEAYDFVYAGPGLPTNLTVALQDVGRHADSIQKAVENGVVFLFTGSARALLGGEVKMRNGEKYNGIGLLCEEHFETPKIQVMDAVAVRPGSPAEYVGFYNRSIQTIAATEKPMFQAVIGCGDRKEAIYEGVVKNNLYATWMLGPILVRNPQLMDELLSKLMGADYVRYDNAYEIKAMERSLQDIKEAAGKKSAIRE